MGAGLKPARSAPGTNERMPGIVRNRPQQMERVASVLGAILQLSAIVLLAPLAVLAMDVATGRTEVSSNCFLAPAALSLALGTLLKRFGKTGELNQRAGFLVCILAWVLVSAIGAIPLWSGVPMPYLDAFFEAVSGFTTTGITMLVGLDSLPRSLLFWRGLMQWIGGLGILALFLAVAHGGGSSHRLFGAESHKIASTRPVPSLTRTLHAFWLIYALLTLAVTVLLILAGTSGFDAVMHACTALSTGGFSPYDASIAYYRKAGYPHYRAIEWILIAGMTAGGTNFLVHYRFLTGRIRALWDSLEVRLWWAIILGSVGLILASRLLAFGSIPNMDAVRDAFFQTTAIVTTTGFGTRDIGSPYYPAAIKQLFLLLMVVGGCVGSTGGGIKVLRIGVLWKMMARQVRRAVLGPRAVVPVVVDGNPVPAEELRRIAALFFAWGVLLALGSGITALFSNLGPLAAASGMFSALGNIGPCYIPVAQNAALSPVVKITWIVGMLAGRLEIIPVLILLDRRAWR